VDVSSLVEERRRTRRTLTPFDQSVKHGAAHLSLDSRLETLTPNESKIIASCSTGSDESSWRRTTLDATLLFGEGNADTGESQADQPQS
jgi:hypothetical protein